MIAPCSLALKQCLPCNDDPIRNITAEAPDVDVFIGFRDFKWNPPLGVTYFQLSCKSICFSEVSQQDANLCALRSAEECTYDGGKPPAPPVPPGPNETGGKGGGHNLPPQNPRFPIRRFRNSVQTCDVLCADGSPFTETVAAGTIVELSQALADEKARSLACRLAQRNLFCISGETPPSVCVGISYFYQLGTSNGEDLIWSIDGNLPPGLTFDFFDATITGTPTVGGSYTFIVEVTDSLGRSQTKVLTICVMEIVTGTALPNATIGLVYAQPLVQQPATVSSEIWTLVSGNLPPGILLAENGSLTGIPTDLGTSTFAIKVDATCNGSAVSCQKTFTLEVAEVGCGVDWDAITWDIFSTNSTGTAGAGGSAVGGLLQFDLEDNPTATNAGEAFVHAHGFIVADAHACTFKLRLNVIQQNVPLGTGDIFFGIALFQDGAQIFSKHHGNGAFPFSPTLALGVNEFSVSLVEAPGSLIEIRADIFGPGPLEDILGIAGGIVNGPHIEFEMAITMSDT
jgi:hypothetical protein